MTYKHILSVLFFALPLIGIAQRLEELENVDLSKLKGQLKEGLKKYTEAAPLELSGGVAVNTVTTLQSQGSGTQPFSFVASGNILLTIKGYKLPFAFNYSNWKFSKTNPSFRFNRFAFQPKLKNTGLMIGDASMTFSPYTLNGFQMTGAGTEITPGKFKIQLIAGRMMKAVKEDTLSQIVPSFKRLGAGFKALYNNDNRKIGIALFYAKDDEKSIPMPTKNDFQLIKPMENIAFSVEGGLKLAKQLSWEGELATSVLTENLMSSDANKQNINPLLKLLKSPNTTTRSFNAVKSNLNYIIGQEGMIGIGYERVAPEYRTLGAYYFTNDFQNITVNAQHTGRLNLGLSTGIQYDNLNDKKGSNSGRMVISSNVAFKATEHININGNYSNFQSFTFIRTGFERFNGVTPFENLDTLNFTLLTQNAMVSANYSFKQDSNKAQSLAANINFMESDTKRGSLTVGTPQLNNGSRFLNSAINYSLSFPSKKTTIVTGLNLSYNYGGLSNTLTIGPMAMIAKPVFKQILANTMVAYNISQTSQINQHVVTLNLGGNTTLNKKHNLTANILLQHRITNRTAPMLIFTGSVGYNYTFGYKLKKIPFKKEDLKESMEVK